MPYQLEIDADTGVCIETWTGELTVNDVHASIESRHADPRFDESTPRLIDLTEAEGRLSSHEIRELAVMHQASRFRGACAFVAPRDYQYGFTKVFEAMAQGDRLVGVFRSRESALHWLSGA